MGEITIPKSHKTRKWSKEDFTGYEDGQLGLPCEPSDAVDIISDKIYDTGRWDEYHELIFKYEDKCYRSYYSRGLTEYQPQKPYEDGDEVECVEVEPKEVLVTQYVPVVE